MQLNSGRVAILAAFLTGSALLAGDVGVLNSFNNGEIADAALINENFEDLREAINGFGTVRSDATVMRSPDGSRCVRTYLTNDDYTVRFQPVDCTTLADVGLTQVDGAWQLNGTYLENCRAYRDSASYSSEGDGLYWIDPDQNDPSNRYKAYCDMTTDNGGWTLVMRLATADGGQLNWDSAFWTNTATLGTDPTNVNLDYKSQAYMDLPFDKVMIQSWATGVKEASRSFSNGAVHLNMQDAMTNTGTCDALMSTSTGSIGSPHTQDPVLHGTVLYRSCQLSANEWARLVDQTTIAHGDGVFGLGVCGDSCNNYRADARPKLDGTPWYCNTGNKYYGAENFCYQNSTFSPSYALGSYSWDVYVKQ